MMQKKIKLKVTFDCKLAENIVGTFIIKNRHHDDDELMRYRVPIKILLNDYGYSKVDVKKIERVED